MNTVKIYRIYCHNAPEMYATGERLSLEPWGKNTPDYQGEDDGGTEYILPDGYHVSEDRAGTPHIYPVGESCPCGLSINKGGIPTITAVTYPGYIALRRAHAIDQQ